jgi:GNAT superfamily N-acetyltransferase
MDVQLSNVNDATDASASWVKLAELLHEYADQDLAQPELSTIWQDLEDLPKRYGPPIGGAVLLQVDHVLAGCVGFTATQLDGCCELKRLFVRKPVRGRGYARVLLQEAMHKAKEAGYVRGALSTWPDNPKALELYRSMGFTPTEAFKEDRGQHLVFLGRDL